MSIKNKRWVTLNNELMVKDENGNFNLNKDKEAVRAYFLDYINVKLRSFLSLREKVDFLIQNNYWVDFFQWYSFKDIKKVIDKAYSYKFRFQSYMAAEKFYKTYALKENDSDTILERYEDRVSCVALYLAKDDGVDAALDYLVVMMEQEYQPATPTFLNAGKSRGGELVSCFLSNVPDSINGQAYSIESAMQLSKIGGGVSFDFSYIRGRGESIKEMDNRSSGVLPLMKIMEDTFSYVNQLGQRPGSGAVYLNIFHSDIEEFLDCKKINVDEKSRIKSLSIGVTVPSKFMELAEKDEPFYVFYPYSVYKEYGKHLNDLDFDNTDIYNELVENPNVRKKKLSARNLLTKIATTQKESGYPYLHFKGNSNKSHALNNIGEIKFSNLCTEILEVSQLSNIKNRDEKSEYGYGISCNLGSLNITKVMENKSIDRAVQTAMRMLTTVTDITEINQVPDIAKANRELHSVGLGAMNLHGFLAKNKIMYESEHALEFADKFFSAVNYHTLLESCDIAKERNKTFVGFEKTAYADGSYFDEYLKDFKSEFKSSKVEKLFEGIELPTLDDWLKLKEAIKQYGLYHAYRQAIAPNQSTSYIMNATASVMPIVDPIETREYGNSTTYYPMPYLNENNFLYYKSAYDMNQFKVMRLISVIQKHIDQGISCILHTNSTDTTADLARYYIVAHDLGLKTLYYTRTRKSSIEECISCSA